MSKERESKKDMVFSLFLDDAIEELPELKRMSQVSAEYTNLMENVLKKPKGIYPVEIKGKTVNTVYSALAARIRKQKLKDKIKLHKIRKVLYVEVL